MSFINNNNEPPFEKLHLQRDIKLFLNELDKPDAEPIYKMEPDDARKFLSKLQCGFKYEFDVDIEDTSILTPEMGNVEIRIVRPKGNSEKLPAILYLHGGGWVLGDKDTHDYLIKKLCICSNATIIFPNYERSPEAIYPKALEQCYSVLKYVSGHPDEFNINSDKMVVAGDSVGANMATAIALKSKLENGPFIRAQILLYPVTSAKMDSHSYNEFKDGPWLSKKAMEWFWDSYAPHKERREEIYASPLGAEIEDLKGLPEALIITNEYDVLRDEGEQYAKKLVDANVKTLSIRINGAIHDCMMLNKINTITSSVGAFAICCKVLNEIFEKG